MEAVEALAKILFHLVEPQGSQAGLSAPIDHQAHRIIAELNEAGFVIVPKYAKAK
jgi:hypothetical protein